MSLSVQWQPRLEPLPAQAAVAGGETARMLARRLLLQVDHLSAGLELVTSPGWLVLLGKTEALPWVDGVRYLGREAHEPRLYLPTTHEPSLPVEWIAGALAQRYSVDGPFALTETLEIIPLGRARALHSAALNDWLTREEAAK